MVFLFVILLASLLEVLVRTNFVRTLSHVVAPVILLVILVEILSLAILMSLVILVLRAISPALFAGESVLYV